MRKRRLSIDWNECGQKTECDIIHATFILFLNNLANPFVFPSVMATKYTIFDNLLHTTRIAFFSTTNSSFVMKFTIRYVYGFSGILFAISFYTGIFVLFSIL